MKILITAGMLLLGWQALAQSIVGTWQLTDEKTCFQSEMKESETEKELLPMMGGSAQNAVAKLLVLDKKGKGKEGIFTVGKKKGDDFTNFTYTINGQELLLLDGKSGIITHRLVIEELTENSLRFHDSKKDCEVKIFTRIK